MTFTTTLAALAIIATACTNESVKTENIERTEETMVTDNASRQTWLTLNNGVKMPQFGLGVYSIPAGQTTYNSVLAALKAGYRHIDTAHAYQNERSVGEALRDSGVDRDSVWITSKLWPNEYGKGKTLAAIDRMLKRLGLEYLDLVYFHQPVGDYIEGWKEMEEAVRLGKVRAIGISNFDFNDELFTSMVESTTIKPQIMQIECHPYAQRKHWQEMCAKYDMKIECWFPLGGRDSRGEVMKDKTIARIAEAHGKTPVQTIIRWHIQEGFSVIPGSSNPSHIAENIEVFDFELSEAEMAEIRALDKEKRYFTQSLEQITAWFSGYEIWD